MSNRLAAEKSLYLRQHADNPVDWWPWGPEALAEAARAGKPLLVSIGYSSCHWCHVMAHESFEDPYIAGLMNEHFVCVKVDREERPDVDQLYMEAVQMMNQGQGGWPLNVFCFPDGRPFVGGTYFPPRDNGLGRVPWPQLLVRVSDFFRHHPAELEANAAEVLKYLHATNQPARPAEGPFDPALLLNAAAGFLKRADREHGGFGGAPKFPPSASLGFLLSLRGARAAEARPALARDLDAVIRQTLGAMARGGLYDQFGGGFARYCVDRTWTIPHFEKMLYDNAQLLGAYARGWRRYRDPLYAAVLEETVAWLEAELAGDGLPGFGAALDADSPGGEGAYYTWTPAEVADALPEPLAAGLCAAYGIDDEGNFEHGRTQPTLRADLQTRAELAEARAALLAARRTRPGPAFDPKRLLSWNALAVNGLAEAAVALGRRDWLARAVAVAEFVYVGLRRPDGHWYALAHGGQPAGTATLEDLAFAAEACAALAAHADWLRPGEGARWAGRARELVDHAFAEFADPDGAPGLFFTAARAERLVARKKEWFDNALPAAHSALLHALAILEADGVPEASARFDALAGTARAIAARQPEGVPHALAALTDRAVGVAVVKFRPGPGEDAAAAVAALCAALAERPWRRVLVRVVDDPAQPPGYQVCVGPQCLAPVGAPEAAAALV